MKVLQILTYIESGGAENVVYNYLSHSKHDDIEIDILSIKKPTEQFLESKFRELGCRLLFAPRSVLRRIWFVRGVAKSGKYDIVHCHCALLSEIYMFIFWLYGTKTRIVHSHQAPSPLITKQESLGKRVYRYINRKLVRLFANMFFGCGKDAFISKWGAQLYNSPNSYILNNAVDIEKFAFNQNSRAQLRKELNIENSNVYIHVGRFFFQKNHEFLIKLFEYITLKDPSAILLLVGTGELQPQISDLVQSKKIENNVRFLGQRGDVHKLLNAADVFLLPSLFEGFPVVAVEAQTNGLPIIMSDTITKDAAITDIARFASLDDTFKHWVDTIDGIAKPENRIRYSNAVANSGYDIMNEAAKLIDFYRNCI